MSLEKLELDAVTFANASLINDRKCLRDIRKSLGLNSYGIFQPIDPN